MFILSVEGPHRRHIIYQYPALCFSSQGYGLVKAKPLDIEIDSNEPALL